MRWNLGNTFLVRTTNYQRLSFRLRAKASTVSFLTLLLRMRQNNLSARKKSLLTNDMRILDKENAVCRCMAFSRELSQLGGQCQRKYKFPNGKWKRGVGGVAGGGGGMSACSFSRTAAVNRAVPVCCDCVIGFWFIIHQCFLPGNVEEETCC